MIEKRTHDDFYLKEKKKTKPKFLTTYVYDHLRKKKFNSLLDIGIGNGEFLKYLNLKLPNKKYFGTDVHKKLLIYNKKKLSNIKFFYDDIIKKNKNIKSFKFFNINFPKNLNVKKNIKDFSRTWTLDIGKQKYFINGLGFLNKLYLLKIKMK